MKTEKKAMAVENEWLQHFNISQQELQKWSKQLPPGESLLHWCLTTGKINETAYFKWATTHFQMPILTPDFFSLPYDESMWTDLQETYKWRPELMPITEWDGVLLIACLEPPSELAIQRNYRCVLASARLLDLLWVSLNPENEKTVAIENRRLSTSISPMRDLESRTGNSNSAQVDTKNEVPTSPSQETLSLPPETVPQDEVFESPAAEYQEISPPTFDAPDGILVDFAAESKGYDITKSGDPFAEISAAVSQGEPEGIDLLAQQISHHAANGMEHAPEGLSFESHSVDANSFDSHASSEESSNSSAKIMEFSKPDLAVTKPAPPAKSAAFAQAPPPPPVPPISSNQVEQDRMPRLTNIDEIEARIMSGLKTTSSTPTANVQDISHQAHEAVEIHRQEPQVSVEEISKRLTYKPETPINNEYDLSEVSKPAIRRPTPIAGAQITDDFDRCATYDEVALVVFDRAKTIYQKAMFLVFQQGQLRVWKWTSDCTPVESAKNKNINLETPSIFRIVVNTSLPYHGYIVANPINSEFFNNWNKGQIPKHITICPMIINKQIAGMVLAFTDSEIPYRSSLELMTETASRAATTFSRLRKQKHSA